MSLVLGVIFLFVCGVFGQIPPNATVTVDQGDIVGFVAPDGDYYEFHGIPYADSTSGSNRFKAPRPPPSFQSTFIADRRDIKCVRPLGVGYEGTEDCLVANVYTPNLNNTARLPVMVWIKGKEFDKVYEHELSFKNFMESEVVVVSLNYRESILGFLCLGTEEAPGNAGLKDIIFGLRWIKENIAHFGGDPENVSLFGHGSGAAAVDLISLSPMANGLVHKIIAQSGTALAPWAVSRDNLQYAIEVAEALGHTVSNIQTLTDAFKRTSVAALMAVINELDLTDNSLAFAPCIERQNLSDIEPFLTRTPYQILSDGDYLKIPFMTGFVDYEGTIRAEEALEDDWLEKMDDSFTDFIQPDLDFENEDQKAHLTDRIRSFYFKDQPITTQINNYISYHGDTMILVAALREARLRAYTSDSPVYLYQFSYKGALGAPFAGPVVVNSAEHSEELAYLFYHDSDTTPNLMDLTVSDILVDRWTNFAKTGVPTTGFSQVIWRPFTDTSYTYLRVLDDEEVNQDQGGSLEAELVNPHPETLLFWDQIYFDHFVDAESRWSIEERLDDDDSDVADSEDDEDNEDKDENEESDENEDEDSNGEDDDDLEDEDDDTNSASRSFGHTLILVSLFALLSRIYESKLIS